MRIYTKSIYTCKACPARKIRGASLQPYWYECTEVYPNKKLPKDSKNDFPKFCPLGRPYIE